MRLNPCLVFSFENKQGDTDRCLSDSTATMSLRACLSWFIEDFSDSFSVLSLTELNCSPEFMMLKDRSRMHRKRRLLWEIVATGENLSLAGVLSFRSPHRTIIANPFMDLPVVYSSKHRRDPGSLSDRCAP